MTQRAFSAHDNPFHSANDAKRRTSSAGGRIRAGQISATPGPTKTRPATAYALFQRLFPPFFTTSLIEVLH